MCESANPNDPKRALRLEMREVRRSIVADSADRDARSHRICDRVAAAITSADRETPLAGRRLMVYEPLTTEPDVAALVAWANENAVDVFVPQVDGDELRVMPGAVDPATIDFIVVPGLAFMRDGTRLGQGGGHFDRFLPLLAADCLRLGVAFREQIVDDMPVEPHDVVLDLVVTD